MLLSKRGITAALVMVLCLATWASSQDEGQDRAGENIRAEVTKSFRIVVQSNPSTGYSWTADFDKSFLKLKSSRYVKPSQQIPGRGGQHIFVFIPLKSGQTTIELQYKRPWESAAIELRKYSVSISDVR